MQPEKKEKIQRIVEETEKIIKSSTIDKNAIKKISIAIDDIIRPKKYFKRIK